MCPAFLDYPVYINIWEPHYYTVLELTTEWDGSWLKPYLRINPYSKINSPTIKNINTSKRFY